MGRSHVPSPARHSWARSTLGLFCLACAAPQPAPARTANVAAQAASGRAVAAEGAELFEFVEATSSPEPASPQPSELASFYALCKRSDAALARVAERLARRQSEGEAKLEVSEIAFALRAEGSPYVWPRAWSLESQNPLAQESLGRMRSWLGTFADGGERRCGIAIAESHGRRVLSAVAVDALGDLEAMPVRARSGSWVDVRAELVVPAGGAQVVVLGPSGAPRSVPTSFGGGRVRARVKMDRPGPFTIQILADVAGGPRPVLEARVFTDTPPPSTYAAEPAPGEALGERQGSPQASLLAMINGARASEGLSALTRHAGLEVLALEHAAAMRERGRVAHDAGDGDLRTRVEIGGLELLEAGENVAHTPSVLAAHRALWASPSHRENLLKARFDHVGLGIAQDDDGSLWVCELFADLPGPAARAVSKPSPPAGPGLRAGAPKPSNAAAAPSRTSSARGQRTLF